MADVLARCKARIEDSDREALYAAVAEIERLRAALVATREHILMAMRDLHDKATDTVWLTQHETVFERLASIYGYAGGDPATLAAMWPEYFA